jgi:hypothetical protein
LTKIELEGGKYTVIHDNGANLHALRHGEPWRELVGDGLVLAMAQRIEDLEVLSVERVMLDVVPGLEGMGEEVYAKSVDDVEAKLGALGDQIEDLQSSNSELRDRKNSIVVLMQQRDQLEELLRKAVDENDAFDRGERVMGEWVPRAKELLAGGVE